MLEAHYAPRVPRIQASTATARVGERRASRRLRVGAAPAAESDALLDLSSKGAKIRGRGGPPAVGAELDLELGHPRLRGPIGLRGEVRWVQPEADGTWRAGIAFEQVRDTTAVALMQLIVLELGSTIYGARGQVGFVAQGERGRLHVYGLDRQLLATIVKEELFALEPAGGEPRSEHGSLEAALAALFADAGRLRVAPPLRPA